VRAAAVASASDIADRLLARLGGRTARLGRRQLHAGAARLGEPDGNRLLRRAGSVLTLSDVLDLFADELAGLSAGGFALTPVTTGAVEGLFLGHGSTSFARKHSKDDAATSRLRRRGDLSRVDL